MIYQRTIVWRSGVSPSDDLPGGNFWIKTQSQGREGKIRARVFPLGRPHRTGGGGLPDGGGAPGHARGGGGGEGGASDGVHGEEVKWDGACEE